MQSTKNLTTICTWNSRGLNSSIPYLRELIKSYDIILINEHWLHECRHNFVEQISASVNYIIRSSKYSSSESYGFKRGQGGVMILWDKTISGITPINEIVHDRICAIRVQNVNGTVFNIYNVYMPAQGCADDLAVTLDELGAILDNSEANAYNIIGGDLNGDMGNLGGPRANHICTNEGRIVYDFTSRYNLYPVNLSMKAIGPINTFYGHNAESCLDYFLVHRDMEDVVLGCETISFNPLNTSDHLPVVISLDMKNAINIVQEVDARRQIKWSKIPKEKLHELYTVPVSKELTQIYLRFCNINPSREGVDLLIDNVIATLRGYERNLPKSRFCTHLKPYWSKELDMLKKIKVNKYRAWCLEDRPIAQDNISRIEMKKSKRVFANKLKELSKKYEEEEIQKAVASSELNKDLFWKLLKRTKTGPKSRISAVRNQGKQVVHDVDSILEVWRVHFCNLSKPRENPNFDEIHRKEVLRKIKEWNSGCEIDDFTREDFTKKEVLEAVSMSNPGKAPGHDGVMKEHLTAAGDIMLDILVLVFKWVLLLEYVPENFRKGIQIPLYKGKNVSTLDPNNYRGITLLSVCNKIYEILLWKRLEGWWHERQVISDTQGACRKGVSSVHTAMLLQETIATELEKHKKVFVLFLDVSKAFDSVWTEGLFFQLHALGVTGRTWRLMYRTYVNFRCCVRIHDKMSKWYPMLCGIHQGGFLSLVKYIIFINSLLVSLKDTGMCSKIYNVKTSPLGYADDLAVANTDKRKVDLVLRIANKHSLKWRYYFNADKSAVLVYGESKRENLNNSKNRTYKLGSNFIKEKTSYDHVGYKTCTDRFSTIRITEKVSKGRRTLNATTGLGIKKGGLSMSTCNIIMWSVIIPIVTYASELWVLKPKDVEILENFQRYSGKRLQRFPMDCSNECSYVGLGWIRFENFIYVKKLLFLRTIIFRDENCIYKKILKLRADSFNRNMRKGIDNMYDSPIYDFLRISIMYDLHDEVMRMIYGIRIYSKPEWKKTVWAAAWKVEREDWLYRLAIHKSIITINKVSGDIYYLVWWLLSDMVPRLTRECELMAKFVCKCSRLKAHDGWFKTASRIDKVCQLCTDNEVENVEHIILRCPELNIIRSKMFDRINDLENGLGRYILVNSDNILDTILGKPIDGVVIEHMMLFWEIVCSHVYIMYISVLKARQGIG